MRAPVARVATLARQRSRPARRTRSRPVRESLTRTTLLRLEAIENLARPSARQRVTERRMRAGPDTVRVPRQRTRARQRRRIAAIPRWSTATSRRETRTGTTLPPEGRGEPRLGASAGSGSAGRAGSGAATGGKPALQPASAGPKTRASQKEIPPKPERLTPVTRT